MFRFRLSYRQVSWPVRPCGGAVGSLGTEQAEQNKAAIDI